MITVVRILVSPLVITFPLEKNMTKKTKAANVIGNYNRSDFYHDQQQDQDQDDDDQACDEQELDFDDLISMSLGVTLGDDDDDDKDYANCVNAFRCDESDQVSDADQCRDYHIENTENIANVVDIHNMNTFCPSPLLRWDDTSDYLPTNEERLMLESQADADYDDLIKGYGTLAAMARIRCMHLQLRKVSVDQNMDGQQYIHGEFILRDLYSKRVIIAIRYKNKRLTRPICNDTVKMYMRFAAVHYTGMLEYITNVANPWDRRRKRLEAIVELSDKLAAAGYRKPYFRAFNGSELQHSETEDHDDDDDNGDVLNEGANDEGSTNDNNNEQDQLNQPLLSSVSIQVDLPTRLFARNSSRDNWFYSAPLYE